MARRETQERRQPLPEGWIHQPLQSGAADRQTCRLCLGPGPLRDSHVIPKFVFDWMKETGGPYFRQPVKPNRRLQDGPKARLLCDACEQRIGLLEGWFSRSVFRPAIERDQQSFNYGPELYRFLLSVLWRGAIWYDEVDGTRPEAFLEDFAAAMEEWRLAILEERVPRRYGAIHLSRPHDAAASDVHVSPAYGGPLALMYVRFAGFLVFGDISSIGPQHARGEPVPARGGTLSNTGMALSWTFEEFIETSTRRARELYERNLSDKQRSVISKAAKRQR